MNESKRMWVKLFLGGFLAIGALLMAGPTAASAAPGAPAAIVASVAAVAESPDAAAANPPHCGPMMDGQTWTDPWNGGVYQCAFKNGRWGWFLIQGCSGLTNSEAREAAC